MPKRVGYLYDKMVDRDFIRAVIQEAAKGRRSRKDIAPVLADLDGYVEKTYELVATESFVPSEPKIREIYDESSEKHRKIKMVPFWPDGVIQWMLVTAMKPVLMRGMHPWSCASIPGRGGKHIYKKIRGALRNDPKGTKYAAELDVAQYYPSISGKRLIWALARKIKDKRFLRTVYSIIESCGGGLAIGYYICQWLANFYLESLDQYIMTLPGVKYMTRYGTPDWSLVKEEEDMAEITQDKFNEMFKVAMNAYRAELQDNDCGNFSADGRKFVEETGLLVGGSKLPNGEANFMWQDFLTREQFATVLYRFAQKFGLS